MPMMPMMPMTPMTKSVAGECCPDTRRAISRHGLRRPAGHGSVVDVDRLRGSPDEDNELTPPNPWAETGILDPPVDATNRGF